MDADRFFKHHDRIGFEITKKLSSQIREGINPAIHHSHIYLLMYIRNEGTCMVTDIAHHLGITLSAVTSLINKLFKMSMVTRVRSETDRRIVFIGLTNEGIDILNIINQNRQKIFEKYLLDLTDEELKAYFNVVNKIAENIINYHKKSTKCEEVISQTNI